ncbi:hypothetical protein F5Y17DRAFT_461538 [Xylariaceae sp. FL0594]|nr:hypothetical protein F5Y17DRAFT_461538 [Xylariaceae sp. FL0594]
MSDPVNTGDQIIKADEDPKPDDAPEPPNPPPQTFHFFCSLPAELRLMIWSMDLLTRQVLPAYAIRDIAWADWYAAHVRKISGMSTPMPNDFGAVRRHTQLPALFLVNHEARAEALNYYENVVDWRADEASEPKKPADTFHRFCDLPAELRLKIWKMDLLTRKVLPIDYIRYTETIEDTITVIAPSPQDVPPHWKKMFDNCRRYTQTPALLLVNHEARVEALKYYKNINWTIQVDKVKASMLEEVLAKLAVSVDQRAAHGDWSPAVAIPLRAAQYTSSKHLWSTTTFNIDITSQVVEYKYIHVANSNGAVT